ncbi:MAG: hypothetical protein A3D44_04230 [Candidatus Staskawiczbacteria bacterium RIFCSPHIGHO2_02_FULL_42_22]|uniref:Lactamase n=1 Tax=Candidatus Staskawiczbacteria bacterium RIFCSPHIGHO2_02_FULL_42_22 TaxID=1802207 RepID=A0A1G2I3K6_9BACT|nr:MAG: hypothetical protein A3D44_04230 [Candidatus Staskawiczbacteria bacterium RIFCSPHIGHO2_02_FULL_42_22]HLB60883.1 MBL fold metallo-hydrolase [Patescibacteria group bacterium]
MEIKYLGHSSFRIKGKKAVVVTDPFDPDMVGLKFPGVDADIITVSHEHDDHNAADRVQGRSGKQPAVFRGPGEYEVNGVKIYGFRTYHDAQQGGERGTNTVYRMVVDDVAMLHCGDLGHLIDDALLEEIGEINILFVPTGGVYTISEKDAAKVARQVDPNIIIPMHYRVNGLKESFNGLTPVDAFLKEMDKTSAPENKLVISKDTLPDEISVVVLTAS